MSLYQRGKSWYYDFRYRNERYTGNIGPVSKTVAKEILAKKKAEAVEGRYELPSKKPSPVFEAMAEEYLRYYQANRRPRSVARHQMAYQALQRVFAGKRLADITPFLIEKYKRVRKEAGRSEVTINRELAFLKNLFSVAMKRKKSQQFSQQLRKHKAGSSYKSLKGEGERWDLNPRPLEPQSSTLPTELRSPRKTIRLGCNG
jgi:hypothetical protein